jgi:triosephosphate isomerase
MKPILITNFKTYKNGKRALKLAKLHDKIAKKYKAKIMIAIETLDIYQIANSVKIPVLAQHIDPNKAGPFTASILPESVKEAGASGSLLNHSEHKIKFRVLKKAIERCKRLKLKTIVCASNLEEVRIISHYKPDYIAFEDPKLISSGKSISKKEPKKLKKFVKFLKSKKIIPLCGAGISDKEDVVKSLEFGCKGVLVASAIMKAKNPKEKIIELINLK